MHIKDLKSYLIEVKVNKKEVMIAALIGRGAHLWIAQAVEPNWMATLKAKWNLKAPTVPKARIGFMNKAYENWDELWPAVQQWLNEHHIKVDVNRPIPNYRVYKNKVDNSIVVYDYRPQNLRAQQVIRSKDIKAIEEAILKCPKDSTFEINDSYELLDAAKIIEEIKKILNPK